MADMSIETSERRFSNRPVGRTAAVTEQLTVSNRGISWSAVLAGVVIALVVQIALNMFGLSIGANTINPISETNPIEPGLGSAAVLWLAGSMLLSLFAGGWVAGRMSGTFDEMHGLIHGLVTWGLVALVTFFLMTSTASSILGGVTNAIGQGASLLAQGALQAAPAVADNLDLSSTTMQTIQNELGGLLAPPADADTTTGTTGTSTTGAEQDPAVASFSSLEDMQFTNRVVAFLNSDQSDTTAREEIVTMLAERTDMSAQEASAQVDRWTAAYNEVREDAEATARDVGQQLTDTLAAVAGVLFVSLLTGAFAAGIGGWVGTPERERVVPAADLD